MVDEIMGAYAYLYGLVWDEDVLIWKKLMYWRKDYGILNWFEKNVVKNTYYEDYYYVINEDMLHELINDLSRVLNAPRLIDEGLFKPSKGFEPDYYYLQFLKQNYVELKKIRNRMYKDFDEIIYTVSW